MLFGDIVIGPQNVSVVCFVLAIPVHKVWSRLVFSALGVVPSRLLHISRLPLRPFKQSAIVLSLSTIALVNNVTTR